MQPDRKCSSESESKSRIADEECVKLVLNLIVTMVHSLHNSGRPDQVRSSLLEKLFLAVCFKQKACSSFLPKIKLRSRKVCY